MERCEHATEVLADELLDQARASEADIEAALLANLIDEVGAGLEGKLLGEDEGVVAVEKEGGDLQGALLATVLHLAPGQNRAKCWENYLRHVGGTGTRSF